ncbi:MAG: MnhB domain-containing protein [Bacteroidales bacterium]
MQQNKGMTLIVKKAAQLLSGLIALFGLYIMTHGHLTPGGSFAGGTIIAGALILIILAFGDDARHLRIIKEDSSKLENLAILAFLLMATAALLITPYVFFRNYLTTGPPGDLISAGIIPVYNVIVGIEVAAALFTIFLAFVILKEEDL